MEQGLQLLAVSAVTMGLAHTVAKERLFAPLRARLGGHETWAGYLISCPYCASHWIAFLLVPLTGTYVVDVVELGWLTPVLSWFLSSILVTVIAAFLRVGFYFVDVTQGLVRRQQRYVEDEIAELEGLLPRRSERAKRGERGAQAADDDEARESSGAS